MEQHWEHQIHVDVSKKAALRFQEQLRDMVLQRNFEHRWEDHKHFSRIYMPKVWSNLRLAQAVAGALLTHKDFGRSAPAIRSFIQECEEHIDDASKVVWEFPKGAKGYRYFYTPEEYNRIYRCFEFVLNQMELDYNPHLIPHRVRYKPGIKPKCSYDRRKGMAYNGGSYFKITIDNTGAYHTGNWWTYGRKTLGWRACGISIDEVLLQELYIVHEITHAVENYHHKKQGRDGWVSSEMNTTTNELWWVRKFYPDTFRKLKPVMDKRKNKWYSPVPPLDGQDPEEQIRKMQVEDGKKMAAYNSGSGE